MSLALGATPRCVGGKRLREPRTSRIPCAAGFFQSRERRLESLADACRAAIKFRRLTNGSGIVALPGDEEWEERGGGDEGVT